MAAVLGGCGAPPRNSGAGPWTWSAPVTLEAGHSGDSNAVIAAPGRLGDPMLYAYSNAQTPEFDRRDESLGVARGNITDSWYAWPQAPRPSLNNQRSYRNSGDPDRYNYPSTESRRGGRATRGRGGYGHPARYWRDR